MSAEERRVCVVTGSRAEYGLLYWLMRDLQAADGIRLQIVVTGMHLSPEYGLTHREIEADGFRIDERVETLMSSDTPVGTAKSIGVGVIGFADAFARLRPDIVVVLGDRYEILAAAQAALVSNIPIAHIAGGDTTEGAFDEAIRHSITKMAHLHFVTNAQAARRVCQMGEDRARVHDVGSPGIDYMHRMTRLTRESLERDLGWRFLARNLLITYHPATLAPGESQAALEELLAALDALGPDIGLFFTMPNADPEGRALKARVSAYVVERPHAYAADSLGQLRYISLMACVDAVVGNSSSGLYEAPSLRKPTVNIGDRQRGRLLADSVVNCLPERAAIGAAIARAFETDCSRTRNPYGDGHASERIARILKDIVDPRQLLKKRFHMLGECDA